MLGAGRGWATSILERPALREHFAAFFAREDSFSLGVCNGCQMFAQLKGLIPGAEHWPRFLRNRSEQFEARLSLVEVRRVALAVLPRHGRLAHPDRGFARRGPRALRRAGACRPGAGRAALHRGRRQRRQRYPANPNGSPAGITGLTSRDGRSTLLMPHPERVHRTVQMSWHPAEWGEESPWMQHVP